MIRCPFCKNDDDDLLDVISEDRRLDKTIWEHLCTVCSKTFIVEEIHDIKREGKSDSGDPTKTRGSD